MSAASLPLPIRPARPCALAHGRPPRSSLARGRGGGLLRGVRKRSDGAFRRPALHARKPGREITFSPRFVPIGVAFTLFYGKADERRAPPGLPSPQRSLPPTAP